MSADPQVLDGTITINVADLPTDEWWEDGALRALRALAATGEPFTAPDVLDRGVAEPDHPCRWGSLIAKAKQLGIIVKVGYGISRRTGRNGGVCAIWRGVPA